MLEHLDLAALADRRLEALSGGERLLQGVPARALAQQAPVLLLDEPTTGLDVGHQQQVLELVDTLRDDLDLAVVSALRQPWPASSPTSWSCSTPAGSRPWPAGRS